VAQQTIDHNFDLQAARLDRQAATAEDVLGETDILPELRAGGERRYRLENTQQSFANGDDQDVDGANTNQSSVFLELDWTFFDGLGMFARKEQLRLAAAESRDAFRAALNEAVETSLLRYYDFAAQHAQLAVLEANQRLSRRRLREARLRDSLGSGSGYESLLALSAYRTDSAARLEGEAELLARWTELHQAIGTPFERRLRPVDTVRLRSFPSRAELLDQVMAKNPRLAAARKRRLVAEAGVRHQRSDYWPQLGLRSGLDFSRTEAEAGFLSSQRSTGAYLLFSGSLLLYQGGRQRRDVQLAQIMRQRAANEQDRLATELRNQAAGLLERYAAQRKRLDLETENLRIAQRTYALAAKQYRLGIINGVQLDEAQRNLTQNRIRYKRLLFDLKQLEVQLLRLQGKLVD
jgi:outer membrane protein TolC